MQVRLFGELEAVAEGVPVPVRGAKQRALLALLALQDEIRPDQRKGRQSLRESLREALAQPPIKAKSKRPVRRHDQRDADCGGG